MCGEVTASLVVARGNNFRLVSFDQGVYSVGKI